MSARKRAASLPETKQHLIFEAALKVIREKGLHRARMSDIADRAGISYGLVYHYFRSKEDLFDAVLNRWWDELFALIDAVAGEGDDVRAKLGQVIRYFLDTYQQNPDLTTVFVTEISRSTANLTRDRLQHFKRFFAQMEDIIREGQRSGLLRGDFKARYLTYIFFGAMEAFVSAMVLADQPLSGDAQKEQIVESILTVFWSGASV